MMLAGFGLRDKSWGPRNWGGQSSGASGAGAGPRLSSAGSGKISSPARTRRATRRPSRRSRTVAAGRGETLNSVGDFDDELDLDRCIEREHGEHHSLAEERILVARERNSAVVFDLPRERVGGGVGERADVVEFDYDPATKSIRILRTWLDGEMVYSA